jgi:type II secretion system protein N
VRALLFALAFVAGLLWMAPLDEWVLPRLRAPLAAAGAELRVDSLRFALPLGIRASALGIDFPRGGFDADSIYVGITRSFSADACGGSLRGRFAGNTVSIDLDDVDPSRCLRIGKLEVEAAVDGNVRVDGVDVLAGAVSPAATATVDIEAEKGLFRGVLEGGGPDGTDMPLGEWEFSELVLRGTWSNGDLAVEDGHAVTSGVEWQLLGGHIPSSGDRGGLRIDLRARQVVEDPRSRALIGLLPKAARDADGWHNYRVTGSLQSPKFIGVQ